jgi:fatty-acyl-CoA synthase
MSLSYAAGPTGVPLLEQTIGERLRETVERFPQREALVVPHQGYRATTPSCGSRSTGRPAPSWRAASARATASGSGRRNRHEWVVTAVRDRAHRGDPRHDQPRLPGGRARLRAAQGGRQPAGDGRRAACARTGSTTIVLERDWDAFLTRPSGRPGAARRARGARCGPSDPINIQFTSGTTGRPRARRSRHRNILNNAYFTARSLRLHRARPRLRAGAASTTRSGW